MPDFINIGNVLENLELKDGMTGAEFGCGSADFSVALAKKLKRGRVYALDVQHEKLSALKGRLAHAHLNNIVVLACDLEAPKGSTLREDSLDVVLITNVLFQAENKYTILEEAARVLKTGGQVLVVDWLKDGPFSPKEGMIKPEEAKQLAKKAGFSLKKEFAVGDYHYGLLFTK